MRVLLVVAMLGWVGTARAVVVHGTVTGPLGLPVPGARVQLVALEGAAHSVADTVSGVDGVYEIRTEFAGRFLLLTSSVYYAPQLSTEFYGGRNDVLERGIVLDPRAISPHDSELATGLRVPLAQLADAPEQTSAIRLLPRALVAGELAPATGSFLLERGQTGQDRSLLVRGGGPELLGVLVDGEEVNPLGGSKGTAYPLGALGTTGFAASEAGPAVEVAAGPDPLVPLRSGAGVVGLRTPEATNSRLALDYAGDAGNLHTWRDEVEVTATRRRADVLLAASRFDTSNALPNDRFHLGTLGANAGYHISGNTSLRVTARQQAATGALPVPYDLGLTPVTRDARQETVGTAVFQTRTARNWENELGYGLLRSREQAIAYANPAGRMVTVTGANGYAASGTATAFPLPARQDWATERDDFHYRTSYPLVRHVTGLAEIRYGDERSVDQTPGARLTVERQNVGGTVGLDAELRHRVFVQASGEVTHSSSFGLVGTPRAGVTFVPVLPVGIRRFHGTVLHATVAGGVTEPSLLGQAEGIGGFARSRVLTISMDQNLYREKLVLRAGYFHNQFSHGEELLAQSSVLAGEPLVGGGLAYRTQGATVDLLYQPRTRWLVRGTYTYLASLVEQSGALAEVNPTFPGMRIGALTALAGARAFDRPPGTGSVTAGYSGRGWSGWVQGSFAGRSDGSTGTAQTSALLLPNRDLNHGFARLDANLAFVVTRRASVFAQAENLLNDQHIGVIGYPSVPLTVRAGLRFRLGGD